MTYEERASEFFRKENPIGYEAILAHADNSKPPEELAREVCERVFSLGYHYGRADAQRNESKE